MTGFYINDTANEFNKGYIKGSSTQIINQCDLIDLLLQAISQCCCGRFVDNAHYIQPSNSTSITGCLTLRIRKIGRNGNDGLFDLFAELLLCIMFEGL